MPQGALDSRPELGRVARRPGRSADNNTRWIYQSPRLHFVDLTAARNRRKNALSAVWAAACRNEAAPSVTAFIDGILEHNLLGLSRPVRSLSRRLIAGKRKWRLRGTRRHRRGRDKHRSAPDAAHRVTAGATAQRRRARDEFLRFENARLFETTGENSTYYQHTITSYE